MGRFDGERYDGGRYDERKEITDIVFFDADIESSCHRDSPGEDESARMCKIDDLLSDEGGFLRLVSGRLFVLYIHK